MLSSRSSYLVRRLRLLVLAALTGCLAFASCSWLVAILPPPRSVHSSQQAGHSSDRLPGIIEGEESDRREDKGRRCYLGGEIDPRRARNLGLG